MNRHLRTFYLLTLTQVLSLIGSGMTHVAVGIWLFERYGKSTPLLLSGFFSALPLMGGALFFVFFTNALIDGSFASILQLKVPPEMQGRVFGILFQLMYIANPLALALTGPLGDRVLEPGVGGPGWAWVAPLVGSQAGSGMGLLIACAGAIIFLLTAGVYAWPRTRRLEAELPDYGA